MVTAVDVHGFAGAFTLGMVQAGFTLVGKREGPEGFGVENCEANRHLLGYDWRTEACDPRGWTPIPGVDVVFGNPPCSGFSTFSPSHFRGADSPINRCMWDLINYAARCKPRLVVYESVQQAYFQGRNLMQRLRTTLEEKTGLRYHLYHVLHNAASVGGGAVRRRYFFMASSTPFGVGFPVIKAVPAFYEVIGDLRGLRMTWDDQPYVEEPYANPHVPGFRWAEPLRNPAGTVDGHTLAYNHSVQRILDLLKNVPWGTGERMVKVAERYVARHGDLPESFPIGSLERYRSKEWEAGFQPRRWNYFKPAHVIMGNGPHTIVHPEEARTLTYREVARAMGWPDTWTLKQCRDQRRSGAWFGKGICVQCGSWIGGWIMAALNGNPGPYGGEPIGERESYIDVTDTYKRFPGAHRNGRGGW